MHSGDSRQVEISKLKTEIATKSETNLGLRNQMQDTESYAISLKEETKQQQLEIARLRDHLAVKGDENADLLERIKILEYDLSKAEARARETTLRLDEKSGELKHRNADLIDADKEIAHLREQTSRLSSELDHTKRMLDRQIADNGQLQKNNELENQRVVELNSSVKSLEVMAADLKRDVESSRYAYNSLQDTKLDLERELEALRKHVEVLEAQNSELNRELERFIEADEAVRLTLDRRQRVQDLQAKNSVVLRKSVTQLNDVKMRSPFKGSASRF